MFIYKINSYVWDQFAKFTYDLLSNFIETGIENSTKAHNTKIVRN